MSIVTIDNNIDYTLAEGTSEARSVPMLVTVRLGQEFDGTFAVLRMLHAQIARETDGKIHKHQSGLGTVIQAIWLLWCYTARDIAAMKKETNAKSNELATDIAEMKGTISALRAEIDALRTSTDN